MRTFKKLLPFIAGFLVFFGVNALLNYLMIPYQFTRVKVWNIENNTWQDLILGSSHFSSAINPAVLTETTGRTCYNAAAGGQYPRDNYYLLLDACRRHTPERVILEYDPSYWIVSDSFNRNARYQLSVMEWSGVKLSYFRTLCLPGDLRYVLMPWSLYRSDFRKIPENITIKQSSDYRNHGLGPFLESDQVCFENGFTPIPTWLPPDMTVPSLSLSADTQKAWQENQAWFEKTVSFCNAHGIEVMVVMTPLPQAAVDQNDAFCREARERMKELSSRYGFIFEGFEEPWGNENFSDMEGHMYERTSTVFSSMLAKLL